MSCLFLHGSFMRKLIIILLLLSQDFYAQFFTNSIMIEGATLLTRKHNYIWNEKGQDIGSDIYPVEYGVGIFWSGKFNLCSAYQLEIRPGWFISSEYFRSLQVGIYLRRKFGDSYFGAIGFNSFIHYGGSGNTNYPKGGNHGVNFVLGNQLFENLQALFTISKTINERFGGAYLDWIFKLGFEVQL